MKVTNKKAAYEYKILDRVEAGIQLTGPEVKSVKGRHVKIEGAYVRIIGSEVYLINAHIFPYPFARVLDYDPKRTRKLLLHKKEIISLKTKTDGSNLTIVPLAIYTRGPTIKIEIALAQGKKTYDKREEMKKRDIKRDLEREYGGRCR